MSVVIVGGHDCMVRKYIDICNIYACNAKVFTQMSGTLKNKIGTPDLMVLFTNTVSHKMVRCALNEIKGQTITVAKSHSSSMTALKNILEAHISQEDTVCQKN
ncbi:MAG: DUF2325 domain-containing protein [Oscillospiraceae bacterium]|nr:DUF2325 domain-containing protein [Oscillospiraceae bacterium]